MFDDNLPERPLMLNQRKKKSPLVVFFSVLAGLLLVVLLAFAIFNVWVKRTCFVVEVSGSSMLNTVQDGDLLYAKKGGEDARRGDVIIISVKNYSQENGYQFSGDYIIKRLIAVEGDTVACENGVISIKYAGEEEFTTLSEPYANGATPDFDFGKMKLVEEGEIFFLGDNRGNSYDSGEIGCLKADDVVGVVPEWSINMKSFISFWAKMHTSIAVHP